MFNDARWSAEQDPVEQERLPWPLRSLAHYLFFLPWPKQGFRDGEPGKLIRESRRHEAQPHHFQHP